MRRCSKQSRGRLLAAAVLCACTCAACSVTGRAAREESAGSAPAARGVTWHTSAGPIELCVHRDAAPEAVERWLRLVEGDAVVDPDRGGKGYYDGIVFDYTRPRVEIVTAAHPPPDALLFDTELDAEALGLDQERIENEGQAMDVWQQELLVAHRDMGKGDRRPARLAEWVEEWRRTGSPQFLVGVDRKAINEAQGYVYRSGLVSRPVSRGAVSLKPESPTRASPRVSIALADMPQRKGRWMVIGHVVVGLDVADAISLRPLEGRGTPAAKRFYPQNPVVIESVEITTTAGACGRAADGRPHEPGGGSR